MKKLTLTIAIVLGLSMTTFAEGNQGGGLFRRGAVPEKGGNQESSGMILPGHGSNVNGDADQAPVGSGIAVLALLGGAYLLGKKRREE